MAEFDGFESWRWENIKRIVAPEIGPKIFGTSEKFKQAPGFLEFEEPKSIELPTEGCKSAVIRSANCESVNSSFKKETWWSPGRLSTKLPYAQGMRTSELTQDGN